MFRNLILIFLISSLTVSSQTKIKYPTLLWKISGNGLKKDSYLYGTMHVSNKVAYHLSDQFFEAIKSVDVVGLETNPAEWLNNMELTGELSRASGVSLYNPYSGNFYKGVFGMRFPDKNVYKSMLSFDPEIINGLLYRHSRTGENFEENTYIDLFIFQAASKLNKQIVSLEDFIQAEIQARLAALPDSELNDVKEERPDYSNYGGYGNATKIEDAYREGNLDAVDSLTKMGESKNMQKYLLHNRNVFFVHRIDSILKSGKALFSGVGAAHLPGNLGVIEMLRRLKYTVEPVIPHQTKKADKEKEAIDQITKPVAFTKNYANDSLYSVQVPGKLTQIMNFDNIKYYINADMVNGNFYNIARIKTNAVINNLDVSKISAMLDSLFFENIPGKIISSKQIENNGIKGFDIINKTRRGDFQRYHVFITDIEVILFKLGGKGDYINSSSGKQFFSSIKFETKVTNSTTFEPATKGFRVKIPNEYNYSKNDYVGASGLVEDLSAYDRKTKLFFGVKQAIYNDFYYLEEDTFELNRLASYTLKNFKFTKELTFENKKEQNLPCVCFSGKSTIGKKFLGKIYIKGVHYYLAFAIGEDIINYDHEFFKTFEITDFHYISEIKEIRDNDLCFITKDETSNTPASRYNEEYKKAYKSIRDSLKTKKEKGDNFDYVSKSKNYYSPSSHEYAEIYFEKYNNYDFRKKKELIEKINKSLGELQTVIIRPIKKTDENGLLTYEFMMKDTATIRAVKVKIFVKEGVVYQLKVPCDTTIGLKGWANEFYNSFRLMDTAIGVDIFKNKFKLLLNDLVSADTAIQRKATFSLINAISIEKEYLDDYIQFIESDKLNKLNSEAKAQLFVSGGVFENDRIVNLFVKLYAQYTDSAYLQICLLKGLAYNKTKASYKAIADLLIQETPLVGDESTVSNVFKVMQDSLELCASLYPSILKISRNNEYHSSVYKLLSILVKKKTVLPQGLISSKEAILMDANSELKRYNAAQQGKGKTTQYSSNSNANMEEMVALIKENLQTLSLNQAIKNTKYKEAVNLNNQPLLVNFANVLMPFYKTDEKVKQYIDKVAKIKNEQITLPLFILLKKNNITLNDTLAAYYSKNVNTRAFFYGELERENLVDIFSKSFATQQLIVESVVKSYNLVSTYSSYDADKPKDSLLFHKEIKTKNKYESGSVFIYKTPKNKVGLSKWSVAFVPNSKDGKINSDVVVLKTNELYNETLIEAEIENEILDEFSGIYRGRIISDNSANYGGYDE